MLAIITLIVLCVYNICFLFRIKKDIAKAQSKIYHIRLHISLLVIPVLNNMLLQSIEREDFKSAQELESILEYEKHNIKKIADEIKKQYPSK